jgi:hypothetical protein
MSLRNAAHTSRKRQKEMWNQNGQSNAKFQIIGRRHVFPLTVFFLMALALHFHPASTFFAE